eukprot:2968412-Pleurochrysis_carterae.AAC.1
MSASTAFAAAVACSTSPGWWKVRTVSSSHSDRTSTPPSPTCATMSASSQPSCAAAARRAARSICRGPSKVVAR